MTSLRREGGDRAGAEHEVVDGFVEPESLISEDSAGRTSGKSAKKRIAIFGSTGSVGTDAIRVAKQLGNVEVVALVCNSNVYELASQIKELNPKFAGVIKEDEYEYLKRSVPGTSTQLVAGLEQCIEICASHEIDAVVNSAVGIAGLWPTIRFLKSNKDVLLANKETMVVAGEIVMQEARANGSRIIPIDSEHSAILQCIQSNSNGAIEKLILTASGGPFRGRKEHDLENVTVEQALAHPNWTRMGKTITIQSATMANKGREIIEASALFGKSADKVGVVVHPESIVHSVVQFVDGSMIAQMGLPDMKIPIQYALTYPSRQKNLFPRLDLAKAGKLTFEEPDTRTFRFLTLAREAARIGGTAPAVFNGADEEAVRHFLDRKIRFPEMARLVEGALEKHQSKKEPSMSDIAQADSWAREFVRKEARQRNKNSG